MNDSRMVMLGVVDAEPGGGGCHLHRVHNPSVATLVLHYVFPVELQTFANADDELTSVTDSETVLICPTGKLNVDSYIAYLLGKGSPLPVRVGRETKDLAAEAVRRYEAARAAARA